MAFTYYGSLPTNLQGIRYQPGLGYLGYLGAGTMGKPEATEDQKRAWLAQLEDLESRAKKGANAQVIYREAKTLSDEISKYQLWPFERFVWSANIPETANYQTRLGPLMIVAAAQLDPVQAAQESAKSSGSAQLIAQAKVDPNLAANALATQQIAQASSDPLVASLSQNASIIGNAASQAAADIAAGDPFASGRRMGYWDEGGPWDLLGNYKYAIYAGLGLGVLLVLRPYVGFLGGKK